jgi:Uma2 family endonuclease
MVTTKMPLCEQRIILQNISWHTFKTMLTEMGDNRATRLAYDSGTVEIMTPLMPHENSNRLIEVFVGVLCEELGLEVKRTGSLTLTRDDLERGGEPDSSYYIQNEALVRGKENIDLASDPPPDLVLEVEYSRSKIDKLILYASMGIPEFWRYNGNILRIYQLQSGQYVESSQSLTFAPVLVNEIPRFLIESRNVGEITCTRNFRNWVKNQLD